MIRVCLLGILLVWVGGSLAAEAEWTTPGCVTSELDLVFVVDSSDEISDRQLEQMRDFIEHSIEHFDVSPRTTRVSVVMYGSIPKVINYLENVTYTSADGFNFGGTGVIELLGSATAVGGARRTGKALNFVCDVVLGFRTDLSSSLLRRRLGVPKIIVVFAAGYSQDDISSDLSCRPERPDDDVRNYDVTIIGIAISERGETIFKNRHVNTYKRKDSADLLDELQDELLNEICQLGPWYTAFSQQDLVFIIDRSSSVEAEDMRFIIAFLKNMVERFSISQVTTRVSVISVSDTVTEEFGLNDYTDLDSVLEAIRNITTTSSASSQTNVDIALHYAADHAFKAEATYPRSNLRRTVVVITDGYSANEERVRMAASDLHNGGVEIYVVGVGRRVTMKQLRALESTPSWAHRVLIDYYYELPRMTTHIVNQMKHFLFEMYPGELLDVQFLVQYMTGENDGISDYGLEETEVKAWLKRIVDMFHVGPTYSRFGLTMFGNDVQQAFGFSENKTKGEVLKGIDQAQFLSDHNYVNWENVLVRARTEFESYARHDTEKVIFVLSYTRPGEEFWTYIKSLNEIGIKVFWYGLSAQALEWQYDTHHGTWLFNPDTPATLKSTVPNVVGDFTAGARAGCDKKLDLQFLLDGSGSIGETNFKKVKDWVAILVSQFNVGKDATRIGVDRYSNEAHKVFHLDEYWTKTAVLTAVEKILYLAKYTYTGDAINYTLTNSLVPSAGARDGVAKIMVLMTDGASDDDVTYAAKAAHDMKDLTAYVIGVGSAKEADLRTIASEPADDHVYKVSNFDAMNSIKNQLSKDICETVSDEPFVCEEGELDLVVLVDDTTALPQSSDLLAIQDFIKNLAQSFIIRPDITRFAIVQFASKPRLSVPFTSNGDEATLLDAIELNKQKESPNYRPGTNLGSALDFANDILDGREAERNGTQKAVLVIMSNPTDDSPTEAAAQLVISGAEIFGINIGSSASRTRLGEVVTGPSDAYFKSVPDAASLNYLENDIAQGLCKVSIAECKDKSMDLVFVVENTLSMGAENFKKVMKLLSSVADGLNIGPDAVHLSMVVNRASTFGDFNELVDFTGTEDVVQAVQAVTMESGATNIRHALEYARDSAFPKGLRHVRKVVLVVTDGEGLLGMQGVTDDLRLFEEEIGMLPVTVGELLNSPDYPDYYGEVSVTTGGSDQIVADSYNHLPLVRSDVIRTLCRDAQCPLLYRKGQTRAGVDVTKNITVSGTDLIRSMDFFTNNGDMNLKPRKGLTDNSISYRFQGRTRVTTPKSEVFPNGYPSSFTLIVTLRVNRLLKNSWNLVELTTGDGETELAISIDNGQKHITVQRGARQEQVGIFNSQQVKDFFNTEWHKLQFVFAPDYVELSVDCATPERVDVRRLDGVEVTEGLLTMGKQTSSRKSAQFDLLRFDMLCDTDTAMETCCELKNYIASECGNNDPIPLTPPPDEINNCDCPAGPRGPIGPTGPIGPKGDVGEAGLNALPGVPGNKGEKGDTGPPGLPGGGKGGSIQGPPGPPGPPGRPGLPAGTSIRGQKARSMIDDFEIRSNRIAMAACRDLINTELPTLIMSILDRPEYRSTFRGERGHKGLPGEPGYPGERGLTGLRGITGTPGISGLQGIDGPPGPRGPKGEIGERGEPGYGIPGAEGKPGLPGPPGRTVHGRPGLKGQRGNMGVRGPPGHAGTRGAHGVAGHCDSNYCYAVVHDWVSRMTYQPGTEYANIGSVKG